MKKFFKKIKKLILGLFNKQHTIGSIHPIRYFIFETTIDGVCAFYMPYDICDKHKLHIFDSPDTTTELARLSVIDLIGKYAYNNSDEWQLCYDDLNGIMPLLDLPDGAILHSYTTMHDYNNGIVDLLIKGPHDISKYEKSMRESNYPLYYDIALYDTITEKRDDIAATEAFKTVYNKKKKEIKL